MYKALKGAYSLFELVVVLALVTFIMSLSTYFIGIADCAVVQNDLDRLYSVLNFMQRKALLEGKPSTVVFDLKKNTYTADKVYTLSSGVIFGLLDNVLGPPSCPVTVIKEPITWPGKRITFYPDGSIGTSIKNCSNGNGAMGDKSIHDGTVHDGAIRERSADDGLAYGSTKRRIHGGGFISAGALYLTDRKKSILYALTCDASHVTHIRRYRYEGRWVLLKVKAFERVDSL